MLNRTEFSRAVSRFSYIFQLLIFELDRCETPVASFVEEPKIIGQIVDRF